MASPNAIEILPHERIALVGGRPVELTAREFDILERLARHPGWVYSAEQLADSPVESLDASPDSVRVHIAHLRHKLRDAGAGDVIGTVRGVGYRLETQMTVEAYDDVSEPSRQLRDAFWSLERAVFELEAAASENTIGKAAEILNDVRLEIVRLATRRERD